MAGPGDVRSLADRGVTPVDGLAFQEAPLDDRERLLDRQVAQWIELLHANPAARVGLLGPSGLIYSAIALQEHFAAPRRPQTSHAAALALLRYYSVLTKLERTAPRGVSRELLHDGHFGREPWTPKRPTALGQIAPFNTTNIAEWQHAAAAPPVIEQRKTAKGRRRSNNTEARPEKRSTAARRVSRGVGVGADGPTNAILIDFVKEPGMSFATKEGHLVILARVLERVLWASEESPLDYDQLARKHYSALWRWEPPDGIDAKLYFESHFEARPVSHLFTFNITEDFLRDVSKRAHLKSRYRIWEEQKPAKPATTAWFEFLADATPTERMTYAAGRIKDAVARGEENPRPGEMFESGLIYICNPSYFRPPAKPTEPEDDDLAARHPPTAILYDQLWMTPDGRLFMANQRNSLIEGFRSGAVRAAGTVILGYAMIVATTVALVAPGVVLSLAPRLAPLLHVTSHDFVYVFITRWPELLTLTEFGLGIVLSIEEAGSVRNFVRSLRDPKQAGAFLLEIFATRQAIRSPTRADLDLDVDVPPTRTGRTYDDEAPAGRTRPDPEIETFNEATGGGGSRVAPTLGGRARGRRTASTSPLDDRGRTGRETRDRLGRGVSSARGGRPRTAGSRRHPSERRRGSGRAPVEEAEVVSQIEDRLTASEKQAIADMPEGWADRVAARVTPDEVLKFRDGTPEQRAGVVGRHQGEIQEIMISQLPEFADARAASERALQRVERKLPPDHEIGELQSHVRATDPAGGLTDGLIVAVEYVRMPEGGRTPVNVHIFAAFEAKSARNLGEVLRNEPKAASYISGQIEKSRARLETGPVTIKGVTYQQDQIVLEVFDGVRSKWYVVAPYDSRRAAGFSRLQTLLKGQGRQVHIALSPLRNQTLRSMAEAILEVLASRTAAP